MGQADASYIFSGTNYNETIKEYFAYAANYQKEVCPAGTRQEFDTLLRNYRGTGYHVPVLPNGDLDSSSIAKNLHLYVEKKAWLIESIKKLEAKSQIADWNILGSKIIESFDKLMIIKKNYFHEIDQKKKQKLIDDSNLELKVLNRHFFAFMDEHFYLKSFHFPNDHLQNRIKYEKYKEKIHPTPQEQHEINTVFLYRKLVEDAPQFGAQGGDLFYRATLDTLGVLLKGHQGIISDEIRYILDFVIAKMPGYFQKTKVDFVAALKWWLNKTDREETFYKNLKSNLTFVSQQNEATNKLKDFIYTKQAASYAFWQKQNAALMKELFVIDTILLNEVGSVDSAKGLERQDVIKVVLNRINDLEYNFIPANQELYPYIIKALGDDSKQAADIIKNELWLNVLYKEREFSFTYFFMGAVINMFCPPGGKTILALRENNLKFGLHVMKNGAGDFNGVRYFSQISMLGKFNMSSVWNRFEPYPERAGWIIEDPATAQKLAQIYKVGNFRYLYSFVDPYQTHYDVVVIDNNMYSVTMKKGSPVVHEYRNPYLFRYFFKK